MIKLTIPTSGERFYSLTKSIQKALLDLIKNNSSGILTVYCPHTSCAILVAESHEEDALIDMQNFLKELAPRHLPFITHTTEGPDDSVSHMKSIVLNTSLTFIIHEGELMLGKWQGIFLAEFRDAPKSRQVWLKFQAD